MSERRCRCGKAFTPKRAHGRHCSDACRLATWAQRKTGAGRSHDGPLQALTGVSDAQVHAAALALVDELAVAHGDQLRERQREALAGLFGAVIARGLPLVMGSVVVAAEAPRLGRIG